MYNNVAIIAIIMGVTEVFKPFIPDKKYYPILGLILGVLASFLTQTTNNMSIGEKIVLGLILGLSSSGLYDTTVDNLKKIKKDTNKKEGE